MKKMFCSFAIDVLDATGFLVADLKTLEAQENRMKTQEAIRSDEKLREIVVDFATAQAATVARKI